MSIKKKVALNTIIQIIGKIISTFIGLFSLALITRYLGLAGFGKYTTIITFLTFFAVAADLGLTLVTAQMISAEDSNENKILNNLFSFRLVSSLIMLGFAPLIVIFFPYSLEIKLGVLAALIAFVFPALNQVLIGLFQKKLRMDLDVIAENLSRIALIIGIILTRQFALGLMGILMATVLSAAVNFIFHYIFSFKFSAIKLEFDFLIWKQIISKSWPLAITIVLNLIYLRTDTLFLSIFRSIDEVGLYGATYRIIDVLTTIPFMFAGLILPILTRAKIGGETEYFKKVLQKSFDFMLILAIPLVLGAQFLGRPIMIYTAGNEFAESGKILQLLIIAVAFIFLGTMFSHAVIALDKQKKMIGFYIFTSLSALAGYLLLIPKFSFYAAAGVTIYSEALIAACSVYCVYRYSYFLPNFKIALRSLISALAMGTFLYFFTPLYQNTLAGLVFLLLAGCLIYFLILFLMGGIKAASIKEFFSKNGAESEKPINSKKYE